MPARFGMDGGKGWVVGMFRADTRVRVGRAGCEHDTNIEVGNIGIASRSCGLGMFLLRV